MAPIAKGAEPLGTMSLADDGARAHHLPPLAPPVARRTDLIQSAKGWGQVLALRQGTLASGFTRAIDVKDYPARSCSIHQAPGLLLMGGIGEGAAEQIVKKEGAQGFNGFLRQRC